MENLPCSMVASDSGSKDRLERLGPSEKGRMVLVWFIAVVAYDRRLDVTSAKLPSITSAVLSSTQKGRSINRVRCLLATES